VHWAFFEHVIRHIAWDMIGVDHGMGRIAIRDPRIDDRLDMLLDIAYLKKLSLDATRIGTLKAKASEVLRWRDVLALAAGAPRAFHRRCWCVIAARAPRTARSAGTIGMTARE